VLHPQSGRTQTLQYLPPSVAHKTLGHYKEPMGLQKMQFRMLKEKSDKITEFLWTTHFTCEEAWTYYRSCYVHAVTYPLTSSFLTQSQLKSIQTKAMAIITANAVLIATQNRKYFMVRQTWEVLSFAILLSNRASPKPCTSFDTGVSNPPWENS
jgi:hypothetical protein